MVETVGQVKSCTSCRVNIYRDEEGWAHGVCMRCSERQRVAISSAAVDTWLYYGVAAEAIGRLLALREDLQVRLWCGKFYVSYVGEEAETVVGTQGCEPSPHNWECVRDFLNAMGRKRA
mgnify:CR=1 FL=1